MAENVGGDIVHPIVQAMGIATSGVSPGYRGGIMASYQSAI